MTDIRSIVLPAIKEEGVRRLYNFCREVRLTSSSTLFDAGYEQAKRDFKDALGREVAEPEQKTVVDVPTIDDQPRRWFL